MDFCHPCHNWRGGKLLEAGKFAFDTLNNTNVQILEEMINAI